MTSFLLIISFLLHLVLFIIIFYMYQYIQTMKSGQTKDIKELLNQFLQEIRLENKILQEPTMEDERKLNRDKEIKNKQYEQEKTSTMNDNLAVKTVEENIQEENKTDKIETSIHSQVNYLYNQGDSIEDIAKQLNCSTTEVELLIKFKER